MFRRKSTHKRKRDGVNATWPEYKKSAKVDPPALYTPVKDLLVSTRILDVLVENYLYTQAWRSPPALIPLITQQKKDLGISTQDDAKSDLPPPKMKKFQRAILLETKQGTPEAHQLLLFVQYLHGSTSSRLETLTMVNLKGDLHPLFTQCLLLRQIACMFVSINIRTKNDINLCVNLNDIVRTAWGLANIFAPMEDLFKDWQKTTVDISCI